MALNSGRTTEQQAMALEWVDSVDGTASPVEVVREFGREDVPIEGPFMREWRAEMDVIAARAGTNNASSMFY